MARQKTKIKEKIKPDVKVTEVTPQIDPQREIKPEGGDARVVEVEPFKEEK